MEMSVGSYWFKFPSKPLALKNFNSKDITLRTVNVQKYKILFFTSKIDLSTNICLNGILKKIMKRMKVYVHLFVYRWTVEEVKKKHPFTLPALTTQGINQN